MRIIICSHDGEGYFGGPQEWVKRLGPTLREMGHEVHYLIITDDAPSRSSSYLYLKSIGFHCEILRWHTPTKYRDNTEDRVMWFLEKTRQINPDVFIANNIFFAMFAGKWIKEAGIPVIGVLHSDDPTHGPLYENFITRSSEYALSGIVAVSEFISQNTQTHNPFGIPVEVISCGVPLPAQKSSYSREPFKVVYAGKITDYQKRITETTYALCKAVREIDQLEVNIYGDGAEADKIVGIIQDNAKGYPITYHGRVDSSQMQSIFASHQAFVLLSDFEGIPVALMEAMATGMVPICTRISSGIPELITHEKTGYLVNDRDEDFVKVLKTLVNSPESWRKISDAAVKKVESQHAIKVTAQKWIDFSQTLIAQNEKRKIVIPKNLNLPDFGSSEKPFDQRKVGLTDFAKQTFVRLFKRIAK